MRRKRETKEEKQKVFPKKETENSKQERKWKNTIKSEL